jgi:hypothetical protein
MQVLEQFERISSGVHTAKILPTEKLEVGDTQWNAWWLQSNWRSKTRRKEAADLLD